MRRWEAASQGKSQSLRRDGVPRCKGRSLSAKRLAGFAIHVTSAVMDVNGKLVVADQRAKKMRIRKKMRDTGGAMKKTTGGMRRTQLATFRRKMSDSG